MTKYVYFFGAGKAEGSSLMRNLLGGKGCELAEMTNLGIPVPPGLTITVQAWSRYNKAGRQWPEGLREQVLEHLGKLEATAGLTFGDAQRPLLVSVRSGARASMPGMMETVLNLGLNDTTVLGLAAWTKNDRFAWDCYRRFIAMFGSVVLGIRRETFDAELDAAKRRLGVKSDPEVSPDELQKLTQTFKDIVSARTGAAFPQDPNEQLRLAIDAVFDSWFAKKATEYRRIHGIPGDWGTAVTVMAMVFGNLGETSGTGVGFTRDPRTGARHFYAEFLANAQGEDVVAGIRTPESIDDLKRRMPAIYDELLDIADRLERHYKDMQDIEFTVQEGRLYLLQTRSGKRAAAAAVRVAVDLVRESVIDQHTALLRVPPRELGKLFLPVLDPKDTERAVADGRLLARGLPAAPGGAVGHVVCNADRAVEAARNGQRVILERPGTAPEDVAGMSAAADVGTGRVGPGRPALMFFAAARIQSGSGMIMRPDSAAGHAGGKRLLPFRRGDFIGIFGGRAGLPVTIGLLAPPLHEFLPKYTDLLEEYTRLDAHHMGRERLEQMMAKVRSLQEANPMLGHRGCRLGITYPEIYGMQVRAIMEAACTAAAEGVTVEPEIMIPLTGTVGEMRLTYAQTKRVADGIIAEMGVAVKYLIGTMIEVPRAALIAGEIARTAEFFSFGTNDLTQLTFGYSRDDVAKFLPEYLQKGLLPNDPFSVLDQEGVGELIRIGIERGRRARPDLKVGICGEHGGEPASVEFCHKVGMTYVSCSPFMIPIARLSAAQARIRARQASEGSPNG